MKVLFSLLFLLLTGCAVKCHNCPTKPSPVVAHFNLDYCKDLPGVDFECNHVVFTPVTLPVK